MFLEYLYLYHVFTVTERRITNGTVIRRNLIVKCPTPLLLEDLVKDMASKVDLIYDKLAVDNTSGEEDKKDDSIDVIEELDHDYSLEMYQNDNAEETKKNEDDSYRPKALRKKNSRSSKETLYKNRTKTTPRADRHDNKLFKKDINTKLEALNQKIEELEKHFEEIEQDEELRNNVNKAIHFIGSNKIEGVIILNGTESIVKLLEEKITIINNDLRSGFDNLTKKFKCLDKFDLNSNVNVCWSVNAKDRLNCKFDCYGFVAFKNTANQTGNDSNFDDGMKPGEETTKDSGEYF